LRARQSDSELAWLARTVSTDGHNDRESSPARSDHPPTGQLVSSSLQVLLARASVRRHCKSGPLQNCLGATVPVTLQPGLGLPSQGPGNPSDPKGAGDAVGPAPDVRYKPPGDTTDSEECIDCSIFIINESSRTDV
jgi:hypothetical protein